MFSFVDIPYMIFFLKVSAMKQTGRVGLKSRYLYMSKNCMKNCMLEQHEYESNCINFLKPDLNQGHSSL